MNARHGPEETPHARNRVFNGRQKRLASESCAPKARRLSGLPRPGGRPAHDRAISSQTAPVGSAPVDTDHLALGPALAATPVYQNRDIVSARKHPAEEIYAESLGRGHDDVDLPLISLKALGISWGKD